MHVCSLGYRRQKLQFSSYSICLDSIKHMCCPLLFIIFCWDVLILLVIMAWWSNHCNQVCSPRAAREGVGLCAGLCYHACLQLSFIIQLSEVTIELKQVKCKISRGAWASHRKVAAHTCRDQGRWQCLKLVYPKWARTLNLCSWILHLQLHITRSSYDKNNRAK